MPVSRVKSAKKTKKKKNLNSKLILYYWETIVETTII